MKIALKWALRMVTGLLGLFSIFGLVYLTLWFISEEERDYATFSFYLFGFAINLYLIFVAYLTWFRFSPRAIRHLSGIMILCSYAYLLNDPGGQIRDLGDPWHLAIKAAGLVIGFWAWVFLDGLLNRIFFPVAPVTALSSEQDESQSANEIDDQRAPRP